MSDITLAKLSTAWSAFYSESSFDNTIISQSSCILYEGVLFFVCFLLPHTEVNAWAVGAMNEGHSHHAVTPRQDSASADLSLLGGSVTGAG